jgi:predicted Zn-dependent protease with MMP-like domain
MRFHKFKNCEPLIADRSKKRSEAVDLGLDRHFAKNVRELVILVVHINNTNLLKDISLETLVMFLIPRCWKL